MMIGPPEKLRIPYEAEEGSRFHHVGRCVDGKQFVAFVTGAFPDGYDWRRTQDPNDNTWQRDKQWLAVLHLFDTNGNHRSTDVRLGGYDSEGWRVAGEKAWAELTHLLAGLGPGVMSGDVCIKPFSVVVGGVTHSLSYTHFVEGDDEGEWMMLQPRDIMFHPPWDSGQYST